MATMQRRAWSAQDVRALRECYPHEPTAALAARLGRPVGQVYQAAERYGLHKTAEYLASPAACRMRRGEGMARPGAATRFEPDHAPWNKGLAGSTGTQPGCRATQFKPGCCNGRAAQLVQPLGTLRRNKDGLLERKVTQLHGAPHLRWHAVHRLVWEAEHGPVPKGHVVVFRPGRRTAVLGCITLDALELVSRAENMRRNSVHRLGAEVAGLVQLQGAIKRQINRRQRAAQTEETTA